MLSVRQSREGASRFAVRWGVRWGAATALSGSDGCQVSVGRFATQALCSVELQRGSLSLRRRPAPSASKTLASTRGSVALGHRASIDRFAAARGSLRAVLAALHCPMSHTARQALTIFQQWLIAEFKTLSESLKDLTYGAAICRAHCQAAQLYFYINKVQLTLEQPPLNDALFNSISKCFVSSPGS